MAVAVVYGGGGVRRCECDVIWRNMLFDWKSYNIV